MPLRKSGRQEDISYNIRQLLHDYEATGKIGKVRPRDKEHAQKVATAIAFRIYNKYKGGKAGGKNKSKRKR